MNAYQYFKRLSRKYQLIKRAANFSTQEHPSLTTKEIIANFCKKGYLKKEFNNPTDTTND